MFHRRTLVSPPVSAIEPFHLFLEVFQMAPAAIVDETIFHPERDGIALEETSDKIDSVNVLKAKLEPSTQEEKDKTQFRKYEEACDKVKDFYRLQHEKQTVAYNLKARHEFRSKTRAEMTIWEAMEKLNILIDESDPDTSLSQIEHLLQSAEAIRRDSQPRWFQLTGLVHDLGKLLFFFDAQGQWDVVGDTFPVGCAFDKAIITRTLSRTTLTTVTRSMELRTGFTALRAAWMT